MANLGNVLVTGANRGVGLELVKQLCAAGSKVWATCRRESPELTATGATVVPGIDVCSDDDVAKLVAALDGNRLDVAVNNAGYFTDEKNLDDLHWEEERKMIEICAIGPLRVTAALRKANLITSGSKVVVVTSEGGSITLTQPEGVAAVGSNYGHKMSKAAANMMAYVLSCELKAEGMPVLILHPGFVRTDMTQKYSHFFDDMGALPADKAIPMVIHEINKLSLETTGKFINASDARYEIGGELPCPESVQLWRLISSGAGFCAATSVP